MLCSLPKHSPDICRNHIFSSCQIRTRFRHLCKCHCSSWTHPQLQHLMFPGSLCQLHQIFQNPLMHKKSVQSPAVLPQVLPLSSPVERHLTYGHSHFFAESPSLANCRISHLYTQTIKTIQLRFRKQLRPCGAGRISVAITRNGGASSWFFHPRSPAPLPSLPKGLTASSETPG